MLYQYERISMKYSRLGYLTVGNTMDRIPDEGIFPNCGPKIRIRDRLTDGLYRRPPDSIVRLLGGQKTRRIRLRILRITGHIVGNKVSICYVEGGGLADG